MGTYPNRLLTAAKFFLLAATAATGWALLSAHPATAAERAPESGHLLLIGPRLGVHAAPAKTAAEPARRPLHVAAPARTAVHLADAALTHTTTRVPVLVAGPHLDELVRSVTAVPARLSTAVQRTPVAAGATRLLSTVTDTAFNAAAAVAPRRSSLLGDTPAAAAVLDHATSLHATVTPTAQAPPAAPVGQIAVTIAPGHPDPGSRPLTALEAKDAVLARSAAITSSRRLPRTEPGSASTAPFLPSTAGTPSTPGGSAPAPATGGATSVQFFPAAAVGATTSNALLTFVGASRDRDWSLPTADPSNPGFSPD